MSLYSKLLQQNLYNIKFIKYLPVSIHTIEKARIYGSKYCNITKIENKIVKILAKTQNLGKSRFGNLFKFKIFIKV